MSFEFIKTKINDLILIKSHVFEDNRGMYIKNYERAIYRENGIVTLFNESSQIFSGKGVIRGLHSQKVDSQAKLVHVIEGEIFDVSLDLRKESTTFGKYHCQILEGKDNMLLYIPEGFAHGYLTLSENSIFSYQCSGTYLPEHCSGIRWNDPELNIPWPLKEFEINDVIITEKDEQLLPLKQYIQSGS